MHSTQFKGLPRRASISIAVMCALVSMGSSAWAAGNSSFTQAVPESQQMPRVGDVAAGSRLSQYLRKQGWVAPLVNAQGFYLPGLMFNRESLLPAQRLNKQQLLTAFYMNTEQDQGTETAQFLTKLVKAMPATGRLPLMSSDADYMEAHPDINPTLLPGDRGLLPKKPNSVVVVGDAGICEVPYFVGVDAKSYAAACFHPQSWWAFGKAIDHLWLVQPTGQVLKRKVGKWNAEAAEVPMPGAWIVAPYRKSAIQSKTWAKLAEFLGTQGVAYIPNEYSVAGYVVQATEQSFEAQIQNAPFRDLPVSSNDFGLVGLIQTPSARMRKAGNLTVTASRVAPYTRYSFIFQPFDWMEFGFRYTRITNRLFGQASFSGTQTYLDKNIDLKFKVFDETPYLPQLAIGLQDVGGTALFAGEYLVGSKRFGGIDTSLGLGWGYLGGRGDHGNPFNFISKSFARRPNGFSSNGGNLGQLSINSYFKGRTAVFGGVQWHTPIEGLVAKIELDGNNYQSEPLSNPQVQDSAINYGFVYKLSDNVDFAMSVERGNKMGFALSLHENFATFNTPKLLQPKPISAFAAPKPGPVDWAETLKTVKEQTDWEVTDVQTRGSEVRLKVRNGDAAYYADSLDRATSVLNRDLPDNVRWFSYDYDQNGVNIGEHVVDRQQWQTEHTDYSLNGYNKADNRADQGAMEGYDFPYREVYSKKPKVITNTFGLGYKQIFGGADGYLFQFNLSNDTRLNVTKSTWFDLSLAYRILGNYSSFKQGSDSLLPHVRTDLQKYATASRFNIPNFQLTHMGKLSTNVFYSMYGGLLEEMFAGVGGEVLYRPFNSRLAVGLDVNSVRQRGYREDFTLLPYSVKTGHLTAYYDTGISNVLAKVSVGQYLAGDKGITIDLSRVFNNGVKMGAFASKTNVSATQFGEGSFDKGIYITVPLNSFFFKSIPGNANFLWRPLTRDGAAKLNRTVRLYDQTSIRDPRTLEYRAGPAMGQEYQ